MNTQKIWLLAAISAICLMAGGCGGKSSPADAAETGATVQAASEETSGALQAASEEEAGFVPKADDAAAAKSGTEGMAPVYGKELKDGTYPIEVDSSSSMFHITDCELTVKDGNMSAVMTMSGTGYLKLYMGTAEDALEAEKKEVPSMIPFVETREGVHTFKVPVKALDMGIDCSAFSKKKERWYGRVLVFRSNSLPAQAFADSRINTAESLELEDGLYTVEVVLGGGSGRAAVESPARLRVENGRAFATIVWGSSNYDYMKVGGSRFELANTEGNSAFEIPVSEFDRGIPVIADTIAMSEPHEIDYILTFDSATIQKAR